MLLLVGLQKLGNFMLRIGNCLQSSKIPVILDNFHNFGSDLPLRNMFIFLSSLVSKEQVKFEDLELGGKHQSSAERGHILHIITVIV